MFILGQFHPNVNRSICHNKRGDDIYEQIERITQRKRVQPDKNADAVLKAMDEFEERYFTLRRLIENGEFDRFQEEFARGKELRDQWMAYKNNRS